MNSTGPEGQRRAGHGGGSGGEAASTDGEGVCIHDPDGRGGEKTVIVRPDACHQHYKEMRDCILLIAEGTIQKRPGIVNVLAQGTAVQ